ncbi:MAG: glycosyltransferase [Mariniphaga sp.]|nr:glycosyltransferase [Mariniphaga sp.]
MKPLAVMMSVYKNDRLKYLKRSIESILNQTYSDFDFYIQCDGELSNECSIFLNTLSDKRIILFKRKENRGLAVSLNELLSIILIKKYNYIARMDADDICSTDRFEKQLFFMYKNISIDILGGNIEEVDEFENVIGRIIYPTEHNTMKKFFGKRNPLAHVTVLFRKSYFEKAGYYPINTKSDEDTMFWLKGFINRCTFANIDDVLVQVRVNPDFYKRRSRFKQNYNEFKNRISVIKKLDLHFVNYFWVIGRLIILGLSFAGITRVAYLYLRKNIQKSPYRT